MTQLGSSKPFKELTYILESVIEYKISEEDIKLCEMANNDYFPDTRCLDCSNCKYYNRQDGATRKDALGFV